MTPPFEGIGAAALRKEDARFLTGRGQYTDDLNLPDQLRVAFVRSPYPHADLLAIDCASALGMPGVVAVLTGDELLGDGVKGIELDFVVKNHDGRPMVAPQRRPLSSGRVRYAGEPVAMVIADTVAAAKDASEAIVVEYRELPFVAATADAAKPAAPQVWAEAPGNICAEVHYGNREDTERAFARAARIVSLELVNQRLAGNPMEPRAALVTYDTQADKATLYCSHQTPFPLQAQLCATLGLSERQLRVVSRDVGGGFGVKGPTYPEEAALVWAARRLGRTLKWTCERSEAFLSDAHARDHVTTLEMACDVDGHFLALRVDDTANLGAYVSSFGAGPPVFAQAVLSAGPYRTGAIFGRVRLVFTNTVPVDAYRGAGRPENTYMIERLVDCVALEFGISAVEIRRRNLISTAAMPWKTPLGRIYDCGDFPKNLEMALAAADHPGFPRRRAEALARGKLRGFGISAYIEHSGMGPSDMVMSRGMRLPTYESAQVRLDASAGVTLFTGTHSHGQGLATALAQIVAGRLGVRLADIEVRHGDTAELGNGRGTVGSRSMLAGGAAVEVALGKIVAKGRQIAAHMMECDGGDVTFAHGEFTVAGTDKRVSLKEVAHQAYYPRNYPLKQLEPGLDESGYWDPKVVASPNGCHICEVEIDPETGVTSIERVIAVDDFGNIINPMLVEGQMHGGLAQGLGQALLEHCAYDAASAQLLSGSFSDYCMPRADDLPAFELSFNSHPTDGNPLGVKGCGEAGTIGSPPALVNAVVDALGVRHIDMPLTRDKIWRIAADRRP